MLVTQMESHVDPGPIDKSLLYDQDNHISSAIWDGQVTQLVLSLMFLKLIFFFFWFCTHVSDHVY